jgi:hypothetical protein
MKVATLLFSLLIVGCSSFKKTALVSMAGGFAGGYMAGHQLAPEGDNKNLHGLLVGSAVSSLVGAGLIYFLDEDKLLKEKNTKILELTEKLNNQRYSKTIDKEGVISSLSLNHSDMPKEIKNLISPGNWKLYEIDEWKKISEGVMVHQDKELVFKYPKIKEGESE